MGYRIAADLLLLLHVAFVLFVVIAFINLWVADRAAPTEFPPMSKRVIPPF